MAAAAVFSASGPSPASAAGTHPREADEPKDTEAAEADDADVHGGPIDRYHDGGCNLASIGGLPGNWTHGDYVDAVATATGDSALIVQAAQSDCGKPMVAVNHGGPPAHALANRSDHAPGPGDLPAAVPEGAGPPGVLNPGLFGPSTEGRLT